MFKGKKTCEVLRAVRKRVADLNGIQYAPVECTHEGDCIGTCPACERERQYVEEQLSLRAMAGHTLKVVGVAAGLTSMLSGQEAQAQEMIQERDTVQQKFKWDMYGFNEFGGSAPYPADIAQWDEMAAFISKFPEDTFLVVGHTDERGNEKYKLKLSEVKAEFLRKLLVERVKIDPQRIKSIGAGSTECVVPNAQTEPEHEQNRRTTLEFYTPEREKEIREETVILPKFEWNSYCFDFGAGPKPEDMVQWDEMAAFISKFPEDTFLVVGHTDERGSEKYNLKISEVRAEYLRNLLVERGVDPQRIMAIGVGPKECVIRNVRTEFEHEQNRRVTLEFYTPERVEAIKRKIEPSTPLEGVKPIKGKYERKKFIRKKRRR